MTNNDKEMEKDFQIAKEEFFKKNDFYTNMFKYAFEAAWNIQQKRIDELEKSQEDMIDWLDANKCFIEIEGRMACVHIRREGHFERLSCEITFTEAVNAAKSALERAKE